MLRFFVPSSCGFFAILWRMFCGICAEKVCVSGGGAARFGADWTSYIFHACVTVRTITPSILDSIQFTS